MCRSEGKYTIRTAETKQQKNKLFRPPREGGVQRVGVKGLRLGSSWVPVFAGRTINTKQW